MFGITLDVPVTPLINRLLLKHQPLPRSTGGSPNLAPLSLSAPSPALSRSSTLGFILMPAPKSGLVLSLESTGALGDSLQVGKIAENGREISSGLKPWVSNLHATTFLNTLSPGPGTSGSGATMSGSQKRGGSGEAATPTSMMSSNVLDVTSIKSALRHILNMCEAPATQPMNHPVVSSPHYAQNTSYPRSGSLLSYSPSSSITAAHSQPPNSGILPPHPTQKSGTGASQRSGIHPRTQLTVSTMNSSLIPASGGKTPSSRWRFGAPLILTGPVPRPARPRAYQAGLQIRPSHHRPKCLAHERLMLWTSPYNVGAMDIYNRRLPQLNHDFPGVPMLPLQ
jgi:hypothetical protein